MIKCQSSFLPKNYGRLGLDQVPQEKHGSDFFLLPPGVLVDQASRTQEKG